MTPGEEVVAEVLSLKYFTTKVLADAIDRKIRELEKQWQAGATGK